MSTGVEDELRAVVRRCLAGAADGRRFMAGDDEPARVDEELWTRLATDIGVAGLIVPADLGGAGGRFADLAAVLSEIGAALAPVPVLSTAGFAVPALLDLAAPGADDALRRIATNGVTATIVWAGPGDIRVDGDRLTGSVQFVLDGSTADVVLFVTEDQVFSVGSADLQRRPQKTLDLTRGMAALLLDGTPAISLGAAVPGLVDLPLVALAAEQVGLAGRLLDDAVAYAKDRTQFGRPVGSFQAVKHKLADLLLEVEIGRALLADAVKEADDYLSNRSPDHRSRLSAVAATVAGHCGEMATHVTRESLHVFGGIGFTWEHHAHMYFRRAKTDEVLLGHPMDHRRRLAQGLGFAAAGQPSPRS